MPRSGNEAKSAGTDVCLFMVPDTGRSDVRRSDLTMHGETIMTAFDAETIHRQFAVLAELDRLKSVIRQSPLINRTRKENSAEHSWHLAMFALQRFASRLGCKTL